MIVLLGCYRDSTNASTYFAGQQIRQTGRGGGCVKTFFFFFFLLKCEEVGGCWEKNILLATGTINNHYHGVLYRCNVPIFERAIR